jgi:hypothetical protein
MATLLSLPIVNEMDLRAVMNHSCTCNRLRINNFLTGSHSHNWSRNSTPSMGAKGSLLHTHPQAIFLYDLLKIILSSAPACPMWSHLFRYHHTSYSNSSPCEKVEVKKKRSLVIFRRMLESYTEEELARVQWLGWRATLCRL